MQVTAQFLKEVERRHLRYISEAQKGIKRIKVGKGFYYLDGNDVKISNPNTIGRIEDLRIPPAWQNVWICPNPHGHLQAFGFDEKGRKQYIYHTSWIELAQESKFDHLLDFCERLPKIRARLKKDLKINKLVKNKVLATVVWLLQNTFIRVGNTEYARDNKSFGLTTLRNKHVKIKGNKVTFEFKGKSGINHTVEITNPEMVKTIKKCVDIPGFNVFQYIDEDKKVRIVDSGEVNDYLQEIASTEVSAKDFRTWGGTLLSATNLYLIGPYEKEKDLKEKLTQTVKKVSSHLRNTPKICRNYYIHPTIFKSYTDMSLIPHFEKHQKTKPKKPPEIAREEYTVIDLLRSYH